MRAMGNSTSSYKGLKGFYFILFYFLQICNSLGLFDGRILKLKFIKNQKFIEQKSLPGVVY